MAACSSGGGAMCQFQRALRTLRASPKTHQQTRGFSSSISRRVQAELPQFSETSSTELNNLLASIRQHIFIPRRLTKQQRNLIFQPRNWDILINDPIYVDIGSESVKLIPADRNKDVPHPWIAMRNFLRLMETDDAETWRANFPQLMMGFKDAGVKWSSEQLANIIRRAGEASMAPVLLQLAKQAESSGLWIHDLRVAREAMWACRAYALNDKWSKHATHAAMRYAVQMAETLELPFHIGRASFDQADPRVQPDIIAVVAELTAADSALHHGCEDRHGKVRQYFERMMYNIDRGMPFDLEMDKDAIDPREFDEQLTRMVPVRNAILLGQKVLGPSLPQREIALKKLEEFNNVLADASRIVSMRDTRDKKQLAQLQRADRRSTRWNHFSRMFTKPIEGEKS